MRPGEAQLGEVLGSYRLTALLGRGGMAAVYLADHTRLSRRAAVKVLNGQTAADPVAVSRFLTEARLISEIDHPGVIKILDVIEQEAPLRFAYVMEHVDGPTLRRELDGRVLRPVEAARLGMQLTEALRAIHLHQVVHRDLKPSNVLLSGTLDGPSFPLVRLVDFGIAKAQDRPAPHKTATGLIIGTPTYMAPEQVSGEPVTPATDIYALGELLYEMFTGKRVFPEDQRTSLRMKLDPEPPPLEPLPFASSGPTWELIRACLDPEASRRPSHDVVIEVLQTLDAAPIVDPAWTREDRPTQLDHTSTFAGPLLEGPADPVTASGPPPESVEMPRPPPPRFSRWPIAVGAAALLFALLGAAWAVGTRPQPAPVAEVAVGTRAQPAYTPEPHPAAPAPARPRAGVLRAYAPEPRPAAPPPSAPAVALPKLVQVELSSTPSRAVVTDVATKERLGTTPLTVRAIEGEPRQVRLTRDGYRARTVTLSEAPTQTVKLSPKRTRPKPKPKARAKEPSADEAHEDLLPW